jgi:hypothetical protein
VRLLAAFLLDIWRKVVVPENINFRTIEIVLGVGFFKGLLSETNRDSPTMTDARIDQALHNINENATHDHN